MEQSNWTTLQIERMENLTVNCTKNEISRFKIYWAIRLIRKISEYEATCSTCAEFQSVVENMISELEILLKDLNHPIGVYNAHMKSLESHLKKVHHAVIDRHYMHVFTIIGVLLGMTITFIFTGTVPTVEKYGLWVCAIAGFVIGKLLDTYATSKGRTI
ncbi:MAG: hypothetical protein H7X94_01920 [Vallitaleaceae bacterium]|nr:hypothetical protein [Vallitaleaceae bacterium]